MHAVREGGREGGRERVNKLSCYLCRQVYIDCHREVHIHASCGSTFITDEKSEFAFFVLLFLISRTLCHDQLVV